MLHGTNSDEVMTTSISESKSQSVYCIEFLCIRVIIRSPMGTENRKLLYLRHYWSDEAHIPQFWRSDEYFEMPEYELLTPLGVRDIV